MVVPKCYTTTKMNEYSTEVQNPRSVNEPYIHWNPASHLLAQPQRKLEKHAVLYFR